MDDGKIDYSSFFDDEIDDAELLKLAKETSSKNNTPQQVRSNTEAKTTASKIEKSMPFDFDTTITDQDTSNTTNRLASSNNASQANRQEATETDGGLDKVYDVDTEEEAARKLSEQYGTIEGAHGHRPLEVSEGHLEKLAEQEESSDSLDSIYNSLNNTVNNNNARSGEPSDTTSDDNTGDIILEEVDEQDTVPSIENKTIDAGNHTARRRDSSALNDEANKPSAGHKRATVTTSMPSSTVDYDEQADDIDLSLIRQHHNEVIEDNGDNTALVPDAVTINKLESKALSGLENTNDNIGSQALPMPSMSDDNDNEKPEESKYVIHADSDYMLVGDGDIGSEKFDIDAILTDAIDRGASDVHIAAYRPIKLRINGSMYKFAKYQQMDKNDMNDLMTGGGGLINKELLQKFNTQRSVDSAYVIRTGRRHGERFRVHFAEEMNAPAIVFRHIRPQIFTPEEIGLTQDVVDWGLLSQGMILVTGPTGSGKSATLSSILRHVQLTKPGKIITLEEPIETVYPLDGLADIWQREVPENCPSFVRGITDAMREDPDVILVGEIRDYATIQAAMQACNTGHLTFATIHANSAPDVVTRILDLAGDADKTELMSNLARNLKGILSQRLLLKPGNDGRVAVREVIQVGRRQKRQIATGDVDGMAADLRAKAEDLDSKMLMMAIQQKTTLKSARSASMDRQGFDAMVAALSPRARGLIIDDVKHEDAAVVNDPDLIKLH